MKEQWLQDPLAGYEENARHLFSYPDSTMHEYGLDLRRFLGWLKERQVQGAEDGKTAVLLSCTRERIEDYIACLSSEGLRATTINRKIYSLNSFYVWAVHHQLLPASPLVGVRKLKIPRRIPIPLLPVTGITLRLKALHRLLPSLHGSGA